ncbi:MAG: hypothetical protein HZB81_06745 [Deltaproteobacteria bacterium]|nr:hypothetical protein [Deltaproteobacteria bacterium]
MEPIKKYFAIITGIISLCFILLVNTVPAFSQTNSVTIFGPKQYDKPKGKPVTYTDTFHATSTTGTYTLWVQSGAANLNEVKNVSVSINGVEIIGSSDLRNNNPASKVISIQSTNTLTVTLKGQGGNYITVKVLCEGCSGIISPQGGTVTLEGYASVIFPAGAFLNNNSVTVSATSFPETQENYNVSGSIFKAGPRLPYEIRINSGYVAPSTSFDVVLNVPDSFITTLPSGTKLRVFVQIFQEGGEEALDHFEIFPSTFDSIAKTISATLPDDVFTNLRHIEDTYEAIVIVGTTFK